MANRKPDAKSHCLDKGLVQLLEYPLKDGIDANLEDETQRRQGTKGARLCVIGNEVH